MRILVTGGAGFTGCVIADALQREGHRVTVFDALRYGDAPAMGLVQRGIRVIRGDVTRIDELRPEVSSHDAVIHLAAVVGFPACEAEPERARSVNVLGTRNVVDCLRPGQALVYASTCSVYGRIDGACTEDQPLAPLTLYGRTKLDGERIAIDSGAVSLRFATLFGVSACMRFDLMINAFVYRAVNVGWMVLYQPGDRRSFLDVHDAARSYILALQHHEEMAGAAFNVGDPSLNVTKGEAADAVTACFPMRVIHEDVETDPDRRNYDVSFDRIRSFGFKPEAELQNSIASIGVAARLIGREGPWRFQP